MNGLFKTREKPAGQIVMINIAEIVPNRSQPRTEWNNEALNSLAESIAENGILQPICVRRSGAMYEIISGERRTRAAKLAGLTEVPCILMSVDDEQSAVLALIENIQRKDLSYFEEALAIEKLISFYGLTQEEAATRLGKAQSTIANKLRLLRFSDCERRMLVTGNLSERQARSLIRIDDAKIREMTLERVIRGNLNLEQTEQLVDSVLGSNSAPNRKQKSKAKAIFSAPTKIYMNSLNMLIRRIREDNVPCELETSQSENFYEYTIRFPIGM